MNNYCADSEHNSRLKKLIRFVTDDKYRFMVLAAKGFCNHTDDKKYIEKAFEYNMGYPLDLNNPVTFSEKLQWLKLYNRDKKYTVMADKYLVRSYVAEKIGEEYLIPLLGVWDDPDKIDFDSLPNRFVLKCNHNSGLGMCICKDKSKLDIDKVKMELKKGLAQDYYLTGREWPYKDISRKIICEKYMEDSATHELWDYKFFCFGGKSDIVMLCLDRASEDTKFYFFDRSWKLCRYNLRGKNAPEDFTLPKPDNIDKMFDIAELLSKDLPFSRIDLYNSDGKIYFGEITFFPKSGFNNNILPETNQYFGSLISLEHIT